MGSPKVELTLALTILLLATRPPPGDSVGVNYGTLGNDLPSPRTVARLLQATIFDKVKIYDTNPEILQAFANTGIDLIVTVENAVVSAIGNVSAADAWLSSRVLPFLPATSVVAICVGNEYLTADPDHLDAAALFPAMSSLHDALLRRGLDRKIKVTTPHSMAVLGSSFPPSAATFAATLMPAVTSIVQFLADTASPFLINSYPYFAFRDNPGKINIDYTLLGNASAVQDAKGYVYTNMLDAQVDAVRYAIAALGLANRTVEIIVSESGWPSKGGDAATPENAKIYNSRLIKRAQGGMGTPMKPTEPIEVFVFSLFNENKKTGEETERNFGIYNGDGTKAYDLEVRCEYCSALASEKMSKSGMARGPSVWCVAKPHAAEEVLQGVLDFCCGPGGVDCAEVKARGGCFEPEKLHAHASYAMNAYYQMHGRNYWNCDFKGTGIVTFSDPSYGTCQYSQ